MKKILLILLMYLKVDVFFRKVSSLLNGVKVLRYKDRYGLNFNFIDQGGGRFDIVDPEGKFEIGLNSHIKSNTFIDATGGVKIGRYFHTGRNLTIFSSDHNYKDARKIPYDEQYKYGAVVIGDFVWFGCNVTVLPGVEIGEGVIVGANSVVTKSFSRYSIIAGSPAVLIGIRDKGKFEKLKSMKCYY